MKVIKRDGRTAEYDRNKILIAIRKANAEVEPFERAGDDMIDGIIAGIENMKRDTMQVEDFQDIIEQKLMAAGKFDLAKRAKAANLDAIHDTVHEMARDEARHGKAFKGLLERYFG